MKKLPIDLPLRTQTTKVSVGAWEHAKRLKKAVGCRLSDVVSAALLSLTEDQLRSIMDMQNAALKDLPKPMQTVLKNLDGLSDKDRAALRDLLEE